MSSLRASNAVHTGLEEVHGEVQSAHLGVGVEIGECQLQHRPHPEAEVQETCGCKCEDLGGPGKAEDHYLECVLLLSEVREIACEMAAKEQ